MKTYPRECALDPRPGSRSTLHCIRSGLARSAWTTSSGHEHAIKLHVPGDLLGLSGLERERPDAIRSTATTEVVACAIPASVFAAFLSASHPLNQEALRRLTLDLHHAWRRYVGGVERDSVARVADALLHLHDLLRAHPALLNRNRLAEWAGVRVETVIRALTDFDDRGWIAKQGRQIAIVDRAALERLAAV